MGVWGCGRMGVFREREEESRLTADVWTYWGERMNRKGKRGV